MAAVLAGGATTRLSHSSAAELWQLLPPGDKWPEVTVDRWRRPHSGIRWHSTALREDEVTVVRGIPVTTVPRTLLDLAAVLDRRRVERAVNEAEVRRYADPLSLPALLARHPRRRGTAALRSILGVGGIGAMVTRSELEERFLRFVDEHGLPRPATNQSIAIGERHVEADCVWRGPRLIAELDGRAVHATAAAFERDRARDRTLTAGGWRVVRITWWQLSREPGRLAEDIAAILADDYAAARRNRR
jgi:very-short-patch-repair endonuclease